MGYHLATEGHTIQLPVPFVPFVPFVVNIMATMHHSRYFIVILCVTMMRILRVKAHLQGDHSTSDLKHFGS